MRISIFRSVLITTLALLGLVLTSAGFAKGTELKFDSEIRSVSQTDEATGTVTVVINGFEVPVSVNTDTEIYNAGNEILLEELEVGSAVAVEAFLGDGAITAEEIRVLQMRNEHFRLYGQVSEVVSGSQDLDSESDAHLTLLGVDAYLTSETRITQRGSGMGNAVPMSAISVGSTVDLYGHYEDRLIVDRLHIGSRQLGNIEFDGEVLMVDGDTVTVLPEEGGEITVIVNSETNVAGELAPGAFIEVEGMLDQELSVVASSIGVDTDEDGDADDDHRRYRDVDTPEQAMARFSATLTPVQTDSTLSGSVRFNFPPVEKTLHLEVEGASPNVTMSVMLIAANRVLDLGTIETDAEGEVEVTLTFGDAGAPSLPQSVAIGEIQEIELSVDGAPVLTGVFN